MPFTTPIIDDFLRDEEPLSDGGKWYLPRIGSGTTANGFPNDFPVCGHFPTSLGNAAHQAFDSTPGPGLAIRIDSQSNDQEIELTEAGLMGICHRLVRFDLAGNGYWITSEDVGGNSVKINVYKSVGYAKTLLATSTTTPGVVSAADIAIGARAIGSEISGWWFDPLGDAIWHQQTTTTDTTYTHGLVGFGGEGGGGGVMPQSGNKGGNVIPRGLGTPSILTPYSRLILPTT